MMKKYINITDGHAFLTQYALAHMDECCLVFDKGYRYESKYQEHRYYTQMIYVRWLRVQKIAFMK